MPELESLTSRAADLSSNADFWNAVMVWALFVTALAAAVLVVSQALALDRAKKLVGVRSEITRAEEARDAAIRLEADARIAEAQLLSAEANERATKAQASLSLAEQHAAEANAKAEGFRLGIARANERAASANETAEKERLARLQLEARLAPRVLTRPQQLAIGAALKSLGPLTVQVLTCSDVAEVGQLGDAVAASLIAAGWPVATSKVLGGGFTVTGIALVLKEGAPLPTRRAAERLVTELAKHGVGASIIPDPIGKVQPLIGASYGSTASNPDLFVMIGNK